MSMRLIFDASTQSFDQWWQIVFPLAALLFTMLAIMRGARRLWQWTGAGMTVLLLLIAIVIPIADVRHVKAALHDGSALTVEGRISAHKRETIKRFIGTSRGVGISTTHRYSSTTSEQFFVGRQWFWLRVGGYPSGASFTNSGDPPLPLHDGTIAKVTWFEDPWYDNEVRILRLELGPDPALSRGAETTKAPDGFPAFWQRFSQAAGSGDEAGVAALTRFPFLFSGTPLDRDRFGSIWAGIFPQPIRPCFTTASPIPDGDAMSVSCGVYVYIFRKDASGWRLTEFTADPEAG